MDSREILKQKNQIKIEGRSVSELLHTTWTLSELGILILHASLLTNSHDGSEYRYDTFVGVEFLSNKDFIR